MTTFTFDDFGKWIDKVKSDADAFVRQCAMMASERIISRTPVDTGFAKAGWWVDPGNGSANIVDGENHGVDPGGNVTVGRVNADLVKAKAGSVITIANNVRYIEALEYGHSKKRPEGMVRVTKAEMPLIMKVVAMQLGLDK